VETKSRLSHRLRPPDRIRDPSLRIESESDFPNLTRTVSVPHLHQSTIPRTVNVIFFAFCIAMKQHSIPSPDEIEDLLLSCRYGDLDDVKTFIDNFGTSPFNSSRDEHGNTILHMASANGHTGKS
jgi:ankyrin repeat protein